MDNGRKATVYSPSSMVNLLNFQRTRLVAISHSMFISPIDPKSVRPKVHAPARPIIAIFEALSEGIFGHGTFFNHRGRRGHRSEFGHVEAHKKVRKRWWRVASGVWCVVCGVWCVVCGVWCVTKIRAG
jgi:hypothetical protein